MPSLSYFHYPVSTT